MIRLLPADQLWDRYRVDAVGADPLDGAWLSPLLASKTQSGLPLKGLIQDEDVLLRYLLIPLEHPKRHPLPELLYACARAGLFERVSPTQNTSRSRGRGKRRKSSALTLDVLDSALPFLGRVRLMGHAEEGGVAIVAVPQTTPLNAVSLRIGTFSSAQILHGLLACLKEVVRFQKILEARLVLLPECIDAIWAAFGRHMSPTSLTLRASDSRLLLNLNVLQGTLPVSPSVDWPKEASVIEKIVLTFLFLGQSKLSSSIKDEKTSTNLLISTLQSLTLPEKFQTILARCQTIKIGSHAAATKGQDAELGKWIAELQALASESWATEGAACISCEFWIRSTVPARRMRDSNDGNTTVCCPCCGQQQPSSPMQPQTQNREVLKRSPSKILVNIPNIPKGMILIPAGMFLSGERKVPRSLRAYAIDETPVTEGDYKHFLNEVNAKPRDDGPGSRGSPLDRYPVTSITWREANDYAEHYDKRIPTLYEWEKAARGTEGRKFPWGNTFHATCGRLRITKENSEEDGPSPIGSFPDGASPFGVLDMAGNVLEWTCSARRAGERLFRAVKGACFKDGSPDLARCTSVQYLDPEHAEPFVGFRCVKDVE